MQHLGYTLKIDNCFEEVERVFMGERWEEREILWILSVDVEKDSDKQGVARSLLSSFQCMVIGLCVPRERVVSKWGNKYISVGIFFNSDVFFFVVFFFKVVGKKKKKYFSNVKYLKD